jgi:hypothetical protein
MSHSVQFSNGETTIVLNAANGYYLLEYTPASASSANNALTTTVTETLSFLFTGTTQAAIEEKIRAIEQIFRLTEQYRDNLRGKQLWLYFQPDNANDMLRSPIVSGRVTLDKSALDYSWGLKKIKVALIIEREAWWETTVDEEVPLTNGNGTAVMGGITVFNCNDGSGTPPNKRHNYVQIASEAIGGDLPAPFRMEISNTYDSSERLSNVWIGHNVFSNPASFTHVIEGESATYGGSDVSGSSYSSGYARQLTISGSSQGLLAYWALSSTLLGNAAGKWFKILAVLTSTPASGTYVQTRLTFPSGSPLTTVMQDQEIGLTPNSKIQEFGTLQLPPWLVDATSLASIDLSLYGRLSGGGTLTIDYMLLMPVEGLRLLRPQGYNIQYGWKLIDDEINEQIYVSVSGLKAPYYMELGDRLFLEPNRTQRLYFLMNGDTGGTAIVRTASVRIYYRRRYAIL